MVMFGVLPPDPTPALGELSPGSPGPRPQAAVVKLDLADMWTKGEERYTGATIEKNCRSEQR